MIPFAVVCLVLGLVMLPDYSPGTGRHRARPPVPIPAVGLIVLGLAVLGATIGLEVWLG